MKKIEIYTDGACSGNPGPGGWACILIYNGTPRKMSGYEENTTNNQMELLAVINALKVLKEICEVELYTDSAYVCNAFKEDWISSWKANNWKNSANKPVKNLELWQELVDLTEKHVVHFNKVKGHADNELNNECDKMATSEIAKNSKD